MPWVRILLWVGLLTLAGALYYKSVNLTTPPAFIPDDPLFEDHFDQDKYILNLNTYQKFNKASIAMREEVETINFLYFIFIGVYVLLIINCSSNQMNLQQNLVMNNLLRFNIVLAIIVGLADVFENIVGIYQLDFITQYITVKNMKTGRLIVIGWIVLIWFIAIAGRKIGDFIAWAKNRPAKPEHTTAGTD
jgi:hypothetical protein